MDGPATVLFEDRIARCRECGSSIGPRVMINGLRSKLVAMGDSLTSQLELCPAGKVKIMFGPERVIPEPVDKPD